mgnify:CR=1 FL=1
MKSLPISEDPLSYVNLLHFPSDSYKVKAPPGGLEPPTFRLTAERASHLRHRGLLIIRTWWHNLTLSFFEWLLTLGSCISASGNIYGHTMLNAPVLVRSLKLSNLVLGWVTAWEYLVL